VKVKIRTTRVMPFAALIFSSAALLTWGAERRSLGTASSMGAAKRTDRAELNYFQDPAEAKANQRQSEQEATRKDENKRPTDATQYAYEFTQPAFYIRHILIEHNAAGAGKITFERLGESMPISEPFELSTGALSRLLGLWTQLGFLDSNEDYQSAKQFPHLGTMRFHMENGAHKRTAEFNWTNNKEAAALNKEYHRVADQAIFVFDMSIARENQPLNAPKLMEQLESLLNSGGLSDPAQLVPLLHDLTTDEHVPLIARNHAARLLKRIQKR
jgi:hypothetical protein